MASAIGWVIIVVVIGYIFLLALFRPNISVAVSYVLSII